MGKRTDFFSKADDIKQQFKVYKEAHNVIATPTAFMEKFDKREPKDLINERAELYHNLKIAVRQGRQEDLFFEEIHEELKNKDVPARYIKKAIKEVTAEEQLINRHKKEELEREAAQDLLVKQTKQKIGKIGKQFQEENPTYENEEKRRAELDLLKRNEIRSMIEYALQNGYDKEEITGMTEAAGLERSEAKQMVDEVVDEAEERWFLRSEEREIDEYIEENLEMTHTL